jgi:MarR family transcriptional regulator, lower aerobic nicotinate degradation pathway regulator
MDVEAAPARLRGLPSWLLGQAALRAQRLGNAGLGAVGAHRQQYALLSVLEEGGRASQADVGRRLGIDPGDMVRLVRAMQTEGWIERTPDVADHRRKLVDITAAGRRRLDKLDAVVAQVQGDLLAALTPAQRRHLVRLLTLIVGQGGDDDRSE